MDSHCREPKILDDIGNAYLSALLWEVLSEKIKVSFQLQVFSDEKKSLFFSCILMSFKFYFITLITKDKGLFKRRWEVFLSFLAIYWP